MSGHCPFCGSTDIAELADGHGGAGMTCLDCERDWTPRSKRHDDRQWGKQDVIG